MVFVLLTIMFLTWMERKVVAMCRQGTVLWSQDRGIASACNGWYKTYSKEDIIPVRLIGGYLRLRLLSYSYQRSSYLSTSVWRVADIMDFNVGLLYIMRYCCVANSNLLAGWASIINIHWWGGKSCSPGYKLYNTSCPFRDRYCYVNRFSEHCWIVMAQTGHGLASFKMVHILAALGFLLFLIASIAEMGRIPFDFQESEQELVAGFFTEYSGMNLQCFSLRSMHIYFQFQQ